MSRERKPRVKKIREKKSFKEVASGLLFGIISFALAAALFVGLIFLQNYFSDDITYREVIVATADIPANEIITEENISKYFDRRSYNILNTPTDTLKPEEVFSLVGKKTLVPLKVGETVSLKDFTDPNIYIETVTDPIEISLALSSIASSDGGKIRAGDLVNITLMFDKNLLPSKRSTVSYDQVAGIGTNDEEAESEADDNTLLTPVSYYVNASGDYTDTPSQDGTVGLSVYNYSSYAQYILEHIVVSKALDASGNEILSSDKDATAAILIFVVPKGMELEINNALENCSSMRVSKVLYDVDPKDYFAEKTSAPDSEVVEKILSVPEEPVVSEEPVKDDKDSKTEENLSDEEAEEDNGEDGEADEGAQDAEDTESLTGDEAGEGDAETKAEADEDASAKPNEEVTKEVTDETTKGPGITAD